MKHCLNFLVSFGYSGAIAMALSGCHPVGQEHIYVGAVSGVIFPAGSLLVYWLKKTA